MSTSPEFRLPGMVKSAIAREKSASRLAEQINARSREAGLPCRVTHKTLIRIRDCPERVNFTLAILRGLQVYFSAHGESLEDWPIFIRLRLRDTIGASKRIIFLLGSKPRKAERRDDLSRWDNRALATLLTEMSRYAPQPQYVIWDVIWRWPVNSEALADERFHMALADEQASVISFGSPLASLSSEIMLAKMFGVEAFTTPNFGPHLSLLPFYFAWLPRLAKGFRSAFGLTWRELEPVNQALAQQLKAGKSSFFFMGRRHFTVTPTENAWTIPGVIVAQRRPAGNVWLVLAGLAGPATFAAAELVKRVSAELPWQSGAASPVLCIPIKAKVKADQTDKVRGDVRRVCSVDFAGDPVTCPPMP